MPDEVQATSALARLRESEERIASEVRAAELRAAEVVREARAAAEAISEAADASDDELEQLRERFGRDTEAAIVAATAAADRELERLREVDEATIRSLGEWVVSALLRGEADR